MTSEPSTTEYPINVPIQTDRSLRLYSKKHRVYVLREFLLQTYGDYLSKGTVILDVAGGKGDLSWILWNVDDYQSIVVDPRRTSNHIDKSVAYLQAHPDECRKRAVPNVHTYQPIAALMPHLSAKNYDLQTPPHLRIFVDDELVQAVKLAWQEQQQPQTEEDRGDSTTSSNHHCRSGDHSHWHDYWTKASYRTVGFVSPTTGRNDFSLDAGASTEHTVVNAVEAWNYIRRARLVVGFHPDQATDACFELAQALHIPVCVVPCCVFPSEFPHRRFHKPITSNSTGSSSSSSSSSSSDETTVEDCVLSPVERYDDLVAYLCQKYQPLHTTSLDFPGTTTARRIVLYTLPTSLAPATTNTHTHMGTT